MRLLDEAKIAEQKLAKEITASTITALATAKIVSKVAIDDNVWLQNYAVLTETAKKALNDLNYSKLDVEGRKKINLINLPFLQTQKKLKNEIESAKFKLIDETARLKKLATDETNRLRQIADDAKNKAEKTIIDNSIKFIEKLKPVAISIIPQKKKPTRSATKTLRENGFYLDTDGVTVWVQDDTGFYKYVYNSIEDENINKTAVREHGYYQMADGSYYQMDDSGFHPYIYPPVEPIYAQDAQGNYWVDHGDGLGYISYIPELETLEFGYYQDDNGVYYLQDSNGFNIYYPEKQTPTENGWYLDETTGKYWIKDDMGFNPM